MEESSDGELRVNEKNHEEPKKSFFVNRGNDERSLSPAYHRYGNLLMTVRV